MKNFFWFLGVLFWPLTAAFLGIILYAIVFVAIATADPFNSRDPLGSLIEWEDFQYRVMKAILYGLLLMAAAFVGGGLLCFAYIPPTVPSAEAIYLLFVIFWAAVIPSPRKLEKMLEELEEEEKK